MDSATDMVAQIQAMALHGVEKLASVEAVWGVGISEPGITDTIDSLEV